MNINLFFANIKIVLVAFITVYIILIFPIFININITYNQDEFNKINLNIKIFNFIRVFNAYIELIEEGIAIHFNKRFAKIYEYKNLLNIKKKFKPLKDYHILKFNSLINIGTIDNKIIATNCSLIAIFITNFVSSIFNYVKPQLNIKNNVYIYEDVNVFEVKVKSLVILNLLMIIISLIKIILEKLIYAIKNRA